MSLLDRLMRRNRYASKKQRRIVRLLALSICEYCGRWVWDDAADVDHVMPWSRGGWTALPNLAWSCTECNLEKSARTPQEAWPWRKRLRKGWPRR